ncbi:MAG: two-component system response regulator [Elusimicrobia bacterium CG08_land_8_20_14_0_20_59_10]|nr:MAG: two-component system response regulator [Elusimicrobia bacterium CG08_land_8_20_14_0_20_59_10]
MNPKILIVDDDENIRTVLSKAFPGDYTVSTAPDGEAALELIKSGKPDLVFLDIAMPGLSGFDVLARIKEAGLSPVVWMLTGEDELEIALKALDLGAAGYQTKPFDVVKLREIAADVVSTEGGKKKHLPGDKPWSVKKSDE